MAISKMSYMTIIGMSQEREAVLESLMKQGSVQVIEADTETDEETCKTSTVSTGFAENADLRNRLERRC